MLSQIVLGAEVALGVSAVILVHELGHFVAARLCGVRVETFSLGFGPRLFGWKRGATTWQVALVPLGGYVKMAGEEPQAAGSRPAPDELRAKTVGQRFFIYSGGVLMNVLFGVVVFPIALFSGVPFLQPVLGAVAPGGPAWRAGLEPGTRVLAVNGRAVVDFESILQEIALGPQGAARLEILDPRSGSPRAVEVQPEYDPVAGYRTIRVARPFDPALPLEIAPDSPAARAGLRSGDRLIAVSGELPELPLPDQLELALARGLPVDVEVEREGSRVRAHLEPEPPPGGPQERMLGVHPLYNRVCGLGGHPLVARLGLLEGDRLLAVQGHPILLEGDLELALVRPPLASSGEPGAEVALDEQLLRVRVAREGRVLELSCPLPDRSGALDLARAVALESDLQGRGIVPMPGSAAERAGLRPRDAVLRVGRTPVRTFEDLQKQLKQLRKLEAAERPVALAVERELESGGTKVLEVDVTLAALPQPSYGVAYPLATYVYRAESLGEAIRVGLTKSWEFLVDSYVTLKRIVLGQVSSEVIGGIVMISQVSYSWAAVGFAKLLFFLCTLSINLAFINVLPIPVLDGGHLFFLLVEKVKGSPVSERVLGYSQMVGIVLILSLLVYVTYNDLMRYF